MKFFIDILKGMVIGLANIIPGVSGGTMMVSMGIYDTLIYCITHLFKQFKKSLMTLLPFVVGMIAALAILSNVITWALMDEFAALPTNTLFIGLILGGLPAIFKQIKGSKKRDSILGGILFVLFFALVIFMATLKETQDTGAVISLSVLEVLKLTLMGCIASATMVIPGVSGSMMLMLMGYYYPVIGAIKNLINALVALDGGAILYNVGILLPFGIGVVIGIFAIAKLIEILLAKWKCITYGAILGLVVASPFAILMGLSLPGFNLVQVIVSVLTFILGFAAAWLLARKDEKPAACYLTIENAPVCNGQRRFFDAADAAG